MNNPTFMNYEINKNDFFWIKLDLLRIFNKLYKLKKKLINFEYFLNGMKFASFYGHVENQ